MKEKQEDKKYPILSIRVKPEEMAYIRREAEERGLKIAKYVRTVLCPFATVSTVK